MSEINHSFPLKMQLLTEFIDRYKVKNNDQLLSRISTLFHQLFEHEDCMPAEDVQVLLEIKKEFDIYEKEKSSFDPIRHVQAGHLERAYKKYRGLVFDIKTRFDYQSPQVAIQDGLDIVEYAREVIEEINIDLKESHSFNLPREKRNKLLRVYDELAIVYCELSRVTLLKDYQRMVRILQDFSEVL